jgi:hypothetical protein
MWECVIRKAKPGQVVCLEAWLPWKVLVVDTWGGPGPPGVVCPKSSCQCRGRQGGRQAVAHCLLVGVGAA